MNSDTQVKPLVSCIIVNYETSIMVSRCVMSLRKCVSTTIAIEIIVVDNPSPVNDIDNLRDLPIDFVVENDSNVGYGIACNIGRKHAHGDYICILNPDTVVSKLTMESWHDSFKRLCAKQPNAALLVPVLVNENGSIQRSTYHFLSPINYWAYHSIIAGALKKLRKSIKFTQCAESSEFVRIDWAMGAAYLVDADSWDKIQGFSDKFFMYAEDQDFCKRLKENGLSVWKSSKIQVTHSQGEPTAESRAAGILRFFDGLARYIQLHYNFPIRILIRIQVVCDMIIRIISLLLLLLLKPTSIITHQRIKGYLAVLFNYTKGLCK